MSAAPQSNGHGTAAPSSEPVPLTVEEAKVQVERLKEQMTLLDQRREHHMKKKPQVGCAQLRAPRTRRVRCPRGA